MNINGGKKCRKLKTLTKDMKETKVAHLNKHNKEKLISEEIRENWQFLMMNAELHQMESGGKVFQRNSQSWKLTNEETNA